MIYNGGGGVGQVIFHVVSRGGGGLLDLILVRRGGRSSKIWMMDRNFSPPDTKIINGP